MTSRQNFRPRPLDASKQLPVVKSKDELDPPVEGSKDVISTIEAKEAEAQNPKRRGDIPIPMVSNVETYERDYLPTFRRQNTYIRGRGGVGHRDETFVDYDMDEADMRWLAKFNQGQDRLPARRFELLLWRLELVNADANDQQSALTGAGYPDRVSPGIVAQIGNLSKADALQALSRTHALRQHILSAVYAYWRDKRIRRGRPLLRRLQAPTATGDSNPFNVFRPRDKVHRPQTRRRRENSEESLDKMKILRQNLVKAYEVLEWLTRREQRKCHLAYVETDLQQLQLRLRHEPAEDSAAAEAEYRLQAKHKPPKRPLHIHSISASAVDTSCAGSATDPTTLSRFKRRKKERKEYGPAVGELGPPPLPHDPDMLFTMQPELPQLQEPDLPAALPSCRPRIGRGGRLVFDRCRPFTWDIAKDDPASEAQAQNFIGGVDSSTMEKA